MRKIELKPGEVICDRCNGTGKNIIQPIGDFLECPWCPKCHGAKKVDWISNAIWKKENHITPGVYTKEVDLSEYINVPSFDSFDIPDELKILDIGTNNKKAKV